MAGTGGPWGLTLSGGGVLGAAHLGVLQALEAWGLQPGVEVGSSAGGLVVGGRAAGLTTDELTAFFGAVCRDPWRYALGELVSFTRGIFSHTLLGLATLRPMLSRLLEHAPRPRVLQWPATAAVMAVDIGSPGGLVRIQGGTDFGSSLDALQATSALPGLFGALRDGEHLYVDGGLQDDVPVAAARALGATAVLAVNVGGSLPLPTLGAHVSLGELVARAVAYGTATLDADANPERGPLLTLQPTLPAGAGLLSFGDFEALVAAGYDAAQQQKAAITAFVAAAAT